MGRDKEVTASSSPLQTSPPDSTSALMPSLRNLDRKALEQAGTLLKFAAENKQVADNVAKTIAECSEAADNGTWTPDISSRFWIAYSSLCTAIRPVTLDTIANNEVPPSGSRFFWSPVSPSKRAARRYLVILILFLLLAIIFQFIVATASNLVKEAKDIGKDIAQGGQTLIQEISSIRGSLGTGRFSETKLTPDQLKSVSQMQTQFRTMWIKEDTVVRKLRLFSSLTTFGLDNEIYSYTSGTLQAVDSVEDFDSALTAHYQNQRLFTNVEESGSLAISVINSVLPLLLGLVGACAYVTRLISDQIKDATFSSTSPVRHLVRVALGALAGAIVGFGWLGSGISASPLAAAFIAGYAIEPVFATIDNISEKFRQQRA
jgi:hypothetical protein